MIVYIDYSSLVMILKNSNIATITSSQRSNLKLILVAEYLSRFPFDIRHKPCKTNIMPNAPLRLLTMNYTQVLEDAGEIEQVNALMCQVSFIQSGRVDRSMVVQQ